MHYFWPGLNLVIIVNHGEACVLPLMMKIEQLVVDCGDMVVGGFDGSCLVSSFKVIQA